MITGPTTIPHGMIHLLQATVPHGILRQLQAEIHSQKWYYCYTCMFVHG